MTDLGALLQSTWPPATTQLCGPFTLREGAGGGKRVEAATCEREVSAEEITKAERAMDGAGRQALFALRPDQSALDRILAERGYLVLDPTLALSCAIDAVAAELPAVSGFLVWPPLRVMRDIWREGGIGSARLDVMKRASAPKSAILGRIDDQPAGAAFVAVRGDAAMLHALEIREAHRRKGLGRHMVRHAARWAGGEGAAELVVLVTEANRAAIAFYESLGMSGARCYHYRVRP